MDRYPRTWMEDALCADTAKAREALDDEPTLRGSMITPDTFFPPNERNRLQTHLAKAICKRCVVKDECAAYAKEHLYSFTYGIYGGTTGIERRANARFYDETLPPAPARTYGPKAPAQSPKSPKAPKTQQ